MELLNPSLRLGIQGRAIAGQGKGIQIYQLDSHQIPLTEEFSATQDCRTGEDCVQHKNPPSSSALCIRHSGVSCVTEEPGASSRHSGEGYAECGRRDPDLAGPRPADSQRIPLTDDICCQSATQD